MGDPGLPKTFVNAQQVADLAGVSRSAVSRAFTPGASLSEDKRKRILDAAEELGYHVNHLARGLLGGPSGIVSLVVSDLDTPYQSRLVRALVERLQKTGNIALVLAASGDPDSLHNALKKALNYRADATIILSGKPSPEIARTCVESGQRLILINRDDRLDGPDNIGMDNAAAAETALHAFMRAGCERLAVVTSEAGTPSLLAREEAFRVTAQNRGFEVVTWREGPTGYGSGMSGAMGLLAGRERPDAVFCVTDLLACGFVDGARYRFGLDVPRDICVIGFDDIEQSGWDAYQLTTFRPDIAALADRAVALATRAKRAGDAPDEIVVGAKFVWRNSVRPGRADD